MDTLTDIDPQIADAVLANADAYLEGQRRVQEIMDAGEKRIAAAEEQLAKQLNAGVSEETAVDEYASTCQGIRAETDAQLKALEQDYTSKYPAQMA